MPIERLDVHPVALPLSHPYQDATRVETHSRDVLVRLVDSDGAVGWGAATPRSFPTGESQRGTVDVLERILGPAVMGLEPFSLEAAHAAMARAVPGHHAAKCAIDIALYDLAARRIGRPVHDLLGGRLRDALPTLDILPLAAPERMAILAQDLHQRLGTLAFKIKMDRDLELGVRRVAAVRDRLGDGARLVVDANGAWSVKTALEASRRLEPFAVDVIEQPTPGEDVVALAAVTSRSAHRIAADESARPELAATLLALRACDVINVKLTREGGLAPAQRLAAAAQLAGMEVIAGSVVQNGLLDAACAHFFAATPAVVANEAGKSPAWHATDVVAGLRVQDGVLHVPQGPGLGVEVDEDAVLRLRPAD